MLEIHTWLFIVFALPSCAPTIHPARVHRNSNPCEVKPNLPPRNVECRAPLPTRQATSPKPSSHHFSHGCIVTYGPHDCGYEEFAVISQRFPRSHPSILTVDFCSLPTSFLSGPNPYSPGANTLRGPKSESWSFPANDYRTTIFQLWPSRNPDTKGLVLYHTSILLLSTPEKWLIANLQKRGWNVMVALPPDSLFRIRIPLTRPQASPTIDSATMLAKEIDLHYSEQAYATRVGLDYLKHSRPSWLSKKRALIATSAGTFGIAAEVALSPDWDSIILINPGTNLLAAFESGGTDLFEKAADWLRSQTDAYYPMLDRRVDEAEIRTLYRKASEMTSLDSGTIGGVLAGYRLLMIRGTLDEVIPKEQPKELRETLQYPETWTYPLGHHLLGLRLAFETDRLDQWLSNP